MRSTLSTAVNLRIFGLRIESGIRPSQILKEMPSIETKFRQPMFDLRRFFPRTFQSTPLHSVLTRL
jgi:hypothetical protein